jgi:hypothetical protein
VEERTAEANRGIGAFDAGIDCSPPIPKKLGVVVYRQPMRSTPSYFG